MDLANRRRKRQGEAEAQEAANTEAFRRFLPHLEQAVDALEKEPLRDLARESLQLWALREGERALRAAPMCWYGLVAPARRASFTASARTASKFQVSLYALSAVAALAASICAD